MFWKIIARTAINPKFSRGIINNYVGAFRTTTLIKIVWRLTVGEMFDRLAVAKSMLCKPSFTNVVYLNVI